MRLLLAGALLLAGCDGLSIAGSTDCLTVDEVDCEAAISAARVHLPPGYGTISSIRVDQDREGCPLGVCHTFRGTVTFTFWDTPNTVIVTVERSGEPLRSMSAVDVELAEP